MVQNRIEDEDQRKRFKETLTTLTKRYAANAAKFHRLNALVWDPDCVAFIMDKPAKFPAVLRMIRDAVRKAAEEKAETPAGQPYRDD